MSATTPGTEGRRYPLEGTALRLLVGSLLALLILPGGALGHVSGPDTEHVAPTGAVHVGQATERLLHLHEAALPDRRQASVPTCGGGGSASLACSEATKSLSPPTGPLVSPTWTSVCSPCAPLGREGATMAYDAKDGYVVLFGGLYDSTATEPMDTWTYKTGTWTNITATACASGCPTSRFDSTMTWDAKDNYLVLFGGTEYWSGAYYGDTWSFSGGIWSQLSPTSHPTARFYAGLAFDQADNYVVLFGGYGASGEDSDTWTFSGGQWTSTAATGPSARYGDGMAYDAADSYVVMFGGEDFSTGTFFADTWKYVGGSWTSVTSGLPAKRAFIANMMAYDSAISAVLLFGGSDSSLNSLGDTWTFSGGAWTQITPSTSPSVRGAGDLSDDPADGTALQFDGYDSSALADTTDGWSYDGGSIALTASLSALPAATDVGKSVLFSATAAGGTTPYTYAVRYGDGGNSASSTSSHTFNTAGTFTAWLWVNDSASGRATATAAVTINPLPVATPSAAPSPTDVGIPVTFSGAVTGGTSPFTYAWSFGDGSPVSSTQNPTHPYTAAGSFTAHFWANDSVGASATNTVVVVVNALPTVGATASPTTTDVGLPVAFTALGTGGTAPLTYAWAFGDGSAPGSGSTATHAYAARGNYTVRVWANDSAGGSASSTLTMLVNPALSTPSLTRTPSVTDAGLSVAFSASFWGGTPAYTTAWKFGDGQSGTGSSVNHAFLGAGTYAVSFWVNDSAGASKGASVSVQVYPALVLVSFTGSFNAGAPNTLDEGQALNASVVVTGGTAPLSFVYAGTPSGCSSVDNPHLSCTPSTTGNFTIEVQVVDQLSRAVFANLTLHVNPRLQIVQFAATPTVVDLHVPTVFTVGIQGGTSTYSYDYPALPPGCLNGDTPSLSCYATRTGTFTTEVMVHDATGASAFDNATLTVHADPAITSFTATPANSTVGTSVLFQATTTGGSGGLVYNYSGLPPGCSTTQVRGTGGACSISSAGTYWVHITVTDGQGRQANASVEVRVAPAPGILGGLFGSYGWLWILVIALVVASVLALGVVRRNKRKHLRSPEEEQLMGMAEGAAAGAVVYGGMPYPDEVAPSPANVAAPPEPLPDGGTGGPDMLPPGDYPFAGAPPPPASPDSQGADLGAPPPPAQSDEVAPGPPPADAPPPTSELPPPTSPWPPVAAPAPAMPPPPPPPAVSSVGPPAFPLDQGGLPASPPLEPPAPPSPSEPMHPSDGGPPREPAPAPPSASPPAPLTSDGLPESSNRCSICGRWLDEQKHCSFCGWTWD
ncbi:MAG: PKD domain-containing protein [Euryarchaeota archaeon]|nr:PKD domain-containing protein [Euryarchaeota archaeon]MDE2044422.1 PKD domain-containing protein [Thermoplasmata archaeon]